MGNGGLNNGYNAAQNIAGRDLTSLGVSSSPPGYQTNTNAKSFSLTSFFNDQSKGNVQGLSLSGPDAVAKAMGQQDVAPTSVTSNFKIGGAVAGVGKQQDIAAQSLGQVQNAQHAYTQKFDGIKNELRDHIRHAVLELKQQDASFANVAPENALNDLMPPSQTTSMVGIVAGLATTPFVGPIAGNSYTAVHEMMHEISKLSPAQRQKVWERVEQNIAKSANPEQQPKSLTALPNFEKLPPTSKASPALQKVAEGGGLKWLAETRAEDQPQFKDMKAQEDYLKNDIAKLDTTEETKFDVPTNERIAEVVKEGATVELANFTNGNQQESEWLMNGKIDVSDLGNVDEAVVEDTVEIDEVAMRFDMAALSLEDFKSDLGLAEVKSIENASGFKSDLAGMAQTIRPTPQVQPGQGLG